MVEKYLTRAGEADPLVSTTQQRALGIGIAPSTDGLLIGTGQKFAFDAAADGLAVQKSHAAFAGSGCTTLTAALQTVNATPAQLKTIALADNTLYWAEVLIIGRGTAGVDRAKYHKEVLVYRQGASAAIIQGGVDSVVADRETNAAWDATFTVSANNLLVTVTGAAATTINWVCTLRMQAVSGNA